MDSFQPRTVSTLLSGHSKKIKKSSSKTSKKDSESLGSPSSNSPKYATYKKDQKRRILTELQKAFILEFQFDFNDGTEVQESLLLEAINQVSLSEFDKYNKILKRILNRNIEDFVDSTANMTSWRKKVKSWINGFEKEETRGGLVIPNHLKVEFMKGLIVILQKLPYRSLELLRENIFALLEKLFQGKPFDRNTCSKHWWFNYQKKNPEIAHLWKHLKLERTVKKGTVKISKKKSSNTSSTCSQVSSPLAISESAMENFEEVPSVSTTLSPSYSHDNNYAQQNSLEEPTMLLENFKNIQETQENNCSNFDDINFDEINFDFMNSMNELASPKIRYYDLDEDTTQTRIFQDLFLRDFETSY